MSHNRRVGAAAVKEPAGAAAVRAAIAAVSLFVVTDRLAAVPNVLVRDSPAELQGHVDRAF